MAAIDRRFIDVSTSALDDYKDDHDAQAANGSTIDYPPVVKTMSDIRMGADLTQDQLGLVSDALDAAAATHSHSDNYCGYQFFFVDAAIKHVNSLIK